MPRIIVDYGEFTGYRLTELPPDALEELASRYPLRCDETDWPEVPELAITVAVHAELRRREGGGKQEEHLPTLRELAEEIVAKGFQQAKHNVINTCASQRSVF